jgi:ABC-2 type transport system ATP-binding protein
VAEGRTVFVSSHPLDEVEKTCQAAAVIDRGQLVAQGPMHELIGGGGAEVDIGCAQPRLALDLLDGDPVVAGASETADGLRATLASADGVAEINGRLVRAGVAAFRLEPVHRTLEHRFLEITSRLGGRS